MTAQQPAESSASPAPTKNPARTDDTRDIAWMPPIGPAVDMASPNSKPRGRLSARASVLLLMVTLAIGLATAFFVFVNRPSDTEADAQGAGLSTPLVATSIQAGSQSAPSPAAPPQDFPQTEATSPSLDGYFEVTYGGDSYICEEGFDEMEPCVRYAGGTAPSYIGIADIYCSQSQQVCAPYDPAQYVELNSAGQTYLCDTLMGSRYNCEPYNGQGVPRFGSMPALYCSGLSSSLDCSENWYPNEMAGYDVQTLNGRNYICEDARTFVYGDVDCYQYSGGDPMMTNRSFPDLKCSNDGSRLDCLTDNYPSELEGIETVSIDGRDYICRDGTQGQECYQWNGLGSAASATFGSPDFYCNRLGCSPDRYP